MNKIVTIDQINEIKTYSIMKTGHKETLLDVIYPNPDAPDDMEKIKDKTRFSKRPAHWMIVLSISITLLTGAIYVFCCRKFGKYESFH